MRGRSVAKTVRTRVLGLAMLVVIAMFVTLTVSMYNKAFTPIVPVTLEADHVGNQLVEHSDVKINGVVVGEVRKVQAVGNHAELSLALQPNQVSSIPSNVSAQLLPKTLFGQRFVNLVPDKQAPTARHIAAGAIIPEDRTSTSIEVDKALADLQPVLQAVQPQKLASTLNAVSTALDGGRGKKLGDTMVLLNDYLQKTNPSLPNLDHDIQQLANVSDDYNQAAPQLLQALADMTTTSRTLVQQQQNLAMLYGDLTTVSTNLTRFLKVNKGNIIQLASESKPTNDLLAKYAPEYNCVFRGFADQIPRIDQSFGKGSNEPHVLHVNVQLTQTRGKYEPGKDAPRYGENRGPQCLSTIPKGGKAPQYPPGGPLEDGSSAPPAADHHSAGLPLIGDASSTDQPLSTGTQGASDSTGVPNIANSPEEQQLVSALVAPDMQVSPSNVPSWSTLLVGPIYRGAEVTVQ